jgi:CHAT domain-containing protein/tetratricopeptide (TPR) repeat protein
MAAHAERRLGGAEAARMDEHLAGCEACYEVFAETARFVLEDSQDEIRSRRVAFARRPAFRMAAGLAAAAVLLLAVLQVWRSRSGREQPLVAELAEAMGTHRFVEPRLTGGFRHGRLVVVRSDTPPPGLDQQTPAVIAAVARIRARAESDPSAEALGALAITYLVSGDVGGAVKALESATVQDPGNARLRSDLAAAYLVRAARLDEPADLPRALEAAETAIALANPPDEAWFNRALALEGLHLADAAAEAWGDYLDRDATSAWADEARRHIEQLPQKRRSSADEDRSRLRATLDGGAGAVDRLARDEPSLLRDYFDSELLPAWADAHLAGRSEAGWLRDEAQLIGDALLRATGDALPHETARALGLGTASRLHSQAVGHQAFQAAQRHRERMDPSCAVHRAALASLQAGESPRAAWAQLHVVITCLFAGDQDAALAELARIETVAARGRYVQLLGRVRWMQGLILAERGELSAALDRYRLARDAFVEIRERESEAGALALIAQNLRVMGEGRRAWRERLRALALLGELRHPRRQHAVLDEAVHACLAEQAPRTGLHFENALVESTRRWGAVNAFSEALMRRAQLRHALGAQALAEVDLRESQRLLAQEGDPILKARLAAQAQATSGAVRARTDPDAAARSLRESIVHFGVTAPLRLPALQLQLARALLHQGQTGAAEHALLAGIEELERQRTSLQDVRLQVSFFDQGLPLFDDMVRVKAGRGDAEGALAFVERGRSRQLLDALRRSGASGAEGAAFLPGSPLAPRAVQAELDEGVALLYYASFEDRLLIWTVSRGGLQLVTRDLPAARLRQLAARHRAALERHSSPEAARQTGAALHDELVGPLLPQLADARTLVIVPDGSLQAVPFASLLDRRTGRYLVEEHVLSVAPSGTVFVRTSAAASASGPDRRALIVGNPRFDRKVHGGLSDLPGAEAEAVEIAGLYDSAELLTGARATPRAFLDGMRTRPVVHYAGHAVSDASEESGRLLFAPDEPPGKTGELDLRELTPRSVGHARLVVLGACRTATGSVSMSEGALSLARPLLAAGVPTVLAGLWDIDDAVGRRFLVDFHRSFLLAGEPLVALRQTQVAFLSSGDPVLAHPSSWAGFVGLGGLDRRHAFR